MKLQDSGTAQAGYVTNVEISRPASIYADVNLLNDDDPAQPDLAIDFGDDTQGLNSDGGTVILTREAALRLRDLLTDFFNGKIHG
jgi:hypothetical protein